MYIFVNFSTWPFGQQLRQPYTFQRFVARMHPQLFKCLFWGAGVAQASSWSGLERCFSQAGFATANYYQIGLRFQFADTC